jgi:hypothetical protein
VEIIRKHIEAVAIKSNFFVKQCIFNTSKGKLALVLENFVILNIINLNIRISI